MGLTAWAVNGLLTKLFTKLGVFVIETLEGTGVVTLSRTGSALAVFGAIGVAAIVYFALILVTKAISKEDLSLLPKGDKIARILRVE